MKELAAIYNANHQHAAAEQTLKYSSSKIHHHHLSSLILLSHHHYSHSLNFKSGLELLKDSHKKFASFIPSPLPSLFQGAFLTLLGDSKQYNTAGQALGRVKEYSMTKNDVALGNYYNELLMAEKTPMAESKKVEAKVNARNRFYSEVGFEL